MDDDVMEPLAQDCPLCGDPIGLHSFDRLAEELVAAMPKLDDE